MNRAQHSGGAIIFREDCHRPALLTQHWSGSDSEAAEVPMLTSAGATRMCFRVSP